MNEDNQVKKAWVVRLEVSSWGLEDTLNELADDGYQMFRVERAITPAGSGAWTVVAFDPSQIADRQGRALAETMAKLAGLPSVGPMPGPVR